MVHKIDGLNITQVEVLFLSKRNMMDYIEQDCSICGSSKLKSQGKWIYLMDLSKVVLPLPSIMGCML